MLQCCKTEDPPCQQSPIQHRIHALSTHIPKRRKKKEKKIGVWNVTTINAGQQYNNDRSMNAMNVYLLLHRLYMLALLGERSSDGRCGLRSHGWESTLNERMLDRNQFIYDRNGKHIPSYRHCPPMIRSALRGI